MGLDFEELGYKKKQRLRFSQTTAPLIISEIDSFFIISEL